jgi:hypothetical protein
MQVQKLDLSKIEHGRNFLLLGARNTGKSVLLEDLLYQRRANMEFVAAQTSTMSTKEMLCKHIPECLVSGDGFDADLLQRYIDQIRENTKNKKSRRSVWIGDDLAFDTSFMKSKQLKYLSMNGRHDNNETYVTCQYLLNITPAMRSNADIVMALAEPIKSNRRKLFEFFFGVFPTFNLFDRVFDQVTANHGVLCLDRTQKSGKLEDMVKFYRATPNPPPFRLGKEIYWLLSEAHSKQSKTKKKDGVITVAAS